MKKHNLKKRKATKKDLEKLREAFVEIWRDPAAMRQAREIAHAT